MARRKCGSRAAQPTSSAAAAAAGAEWGEAEERKRREEGSRADHTREDRGGTPKRPAMVVGDGVLELAAVAVAVLPAAGEAMGLLASADVFSTGAHKLGCRNLSTGAAEAAPPLPWDLRYCATQAECQKSSGKRHCEARHSTPAASGRGKGAAAVPPPPLPLRARVRASARAALSSLGSRGWPRASCLTRSRQRARW